MSSYIEEDCPICNSSNTEVSLCSRCGQYNMICNNCGAEELCYCEQVEKNCAAKAAKEHVEHVKEIQEIFNGIK